MNYNNVLIRCSAIGHIMTPPKSKEDKEAGKLGVTACTYLGELYRELKYSRKKDFTSKAIEKGIRQEQDAITLLSLTRKHFLTKNTVRLNNEYLTGEPDCFIGKVITETEHGFDTKVSWSLWTFPYENDPLDKMYLWQDHGYIALTGAKKWTTAYCLVNAPANMITAEKQKLWYALDCPDDSNDRYMEKRMEIEKNMIFDMEQFQRDNPGYDLDIRDWDFDIPMSERVKEYTIERDEEVIESIYKQVRKSRAHMSRTYGIYSPQLLIESAA